MSQKTTPAVTFNFKPARMTPPSRKDSTAAEDLGTARLLDMLTYCRPHDGDMEQAFVDKFIMPYEPTVFTDDKGSVLAYVIWVNYRDSDGTATPHTLFSSHVDTVHRFDGRQEVVFKDGYIYKEDGMPLGADDGAGVWLLLEMIDRLIPGCYIYHRGEEKGGIGSSGMADIHEEFLKQFDRAIAFDRRSIGNVITHQGFGRCCSDEFAEEAAAAFNLRMPDEFAFFMPDDSGIYTDTAEYTKLIPECTNISCGYDNEHTSSEWLDVDYLIALREACCGIDWRGLPVSRDPSIVDDYAGFYSRYGGAANYHWPDADTSGTAGTKANADSNPTLAFDGSIPTATDLIGAKYSDILKYIKLAHPEDVADMVHDLVFEIDELKDELRAAKLELAGWEVENAWRDEGVR